MKVINITDDLRASLASKIQVEGFSLRQVQELSGVSFSTLSRFLRGADIGSNTYDAISLYLSGNSPKPKKQIQSKRINVGKKTFLITIELLGKQP